MQVIDPPFCQQGRKAGFFKGVSVLRVGLGYSLTRFLELSRGMIELIANSPAAHSKLGDVLMQTDPTTAGELVVGWATLNIA